MKIVSTCLLGINCKYDGENNLNKRILEMLKKGELIPVCPEQMGGLPTPRTPSEITGGDGHDVLKGKAKVMSKDGKDVTEQFVRGAEECLKIVKALGVKEAILKARSPSCGFGETYDGTFSKSLIKGDGVFAALLIENGVKVKTEEEI